MNEVVESLGQLVGDRNLVGQDQQPVVLERRARVDDVEGRFSSSSICTAPSSLTLLRAPIGMEVFGRENGDLGDLARAFEIRLELGDPRVGRRDRGIGVAVDGTVRVELVADQALGARARPSALPRIPARADA